MIEKEKVIFRNLRVYRFLFNWAKLHHRLYYRKFTISGKENIPKNVPVIFAPNHQNALMDALAVLFSANRTVAFLARADIFKKPFVARLLNLIRMLPVYRIRDGFESLDMNKEIFEKTIQVLKSNTSLCVLPEGNHEGCKRLRSLKKGIFRIAFQAEESNSFHLNLHIVPVGIDYSNYFNAGSDLLVVFGKPIRIADYAVEYHDNPQKTINSLRTLLGECMKNIMIHIPEDHYATISQVSAMFEPFVWNVHKLKRHPYNKLIIKQYIVQKCLEALKQDSNVFYQLDPLLASYNVNLKKLGIRDWLLVRKTPGFLHVSLDCLLSLLLLPLHIYGTITNYLPYKVPALIAKKIKDPHFKSSIQFGSSMILFPLYYLIIILIFGFSVKWHILTLVFSISLPLSGMFAFYNYLHMLKLKGKIKTLYLQMTHNKDFEYLKNARQQILDIIKPIINH